MSAPIDRPGIFKARASAWKVKRFDNSRSVAIAIRFDLLEMLNQGQWTSLAEFGQFQVYGDYFVIGKEGGVNQTAVDQLARSLGWAGSFRAVEAGPPPPDLVQVKVVEDRYGEEVRFKASWLNPGDYKPDFAGKDPEGVRDLDAEYGSLLRAAAGGSTPRPAGRPASPPVRQTANAPASGDEWANSSNRDGAFDGNAADDTPF